MLMLLLVVAMLVAMLLMGRTDGRCRRVAAWTAVSTGGALFVMLMLVPPQVWVT